MWQVQSLESKSNTNKTETSHFAPPISFIYHFLLSVFVQTFFFFFFHFFFAAHLATTPLSFTSWFAAAIRSNCKDKNRKRRGEGAIIAQEERNNNNTKKMKWLRKSRCPTTTGAELSHAWAVEDAALFLVSLFLEKKANFFFFYPNVAMRENRTILDMFNFDI